MVEGGQPVSLRLGPSSTSPRCQLCNSSANCICSKASESLKTSKACLPSSGITIIRAPFRSAPRREGISFKVLQANPSWFLDVDDFTGPNAIRYPKNLCPPRGQLEDSDTLRCTFCKKQYSGKNAKSMWKRHLLIKHKVTTGISRGSKKSLSPFTGMSMFT